CGKTPRAKNAHGSPPDSRGLTNSRRAASRLPHNYISRTASWEREVVGPASQPVPSTGAGGARDRTVEFCKSGPGLAGTAATTRATSADRRQTFPNATKKLMSQRINHYSDCLRAASIRDVLPAILFDVARSPGGRNQMEIVS